MWHKSNYPTIKTNHYPQLAIYNLCRTSTLFYIKQLLSAWSFLTWPEFKAVQCTLTEHTINLLLKIVTTFFCLTISCSLFLLTVRDVFCMSYWPSKKHRNVDILIPKRLITIYRHKWQISKWAEISVTTSQHHSQWTTQIFLNWTFCAHYLAVMAYWHVINETWPLAVLRVTPALLLLQCDKSKCLPRETSVIAFRSICSFLTVHLFSIFCSSAY